MTQTVIGIKLKGAATWDQFYAAANKMEAAYQNALGEEIVLNEDTGLYEMYSRNAATGAVDYNATRTIRWANVELDEDGEEFIYSYSNDPRFVNWKDDWVALGNPDIFIEENVTRPTQTV